MKQRTVIFSDSDDETKQADVQQEKIERKLDDKKKRSGKKPTKKDLEQQLKQLQNQPIQKIETVQQPAI